MTTCFLTYLHMDGRAGMAPIPPTRIRHHKQTYFGLKYRSSDTMSISIKFLKYHMFQVCLRQVLRKVEEFIFYSKYCQTFPDHEKVLNRFINGTIKQFAKKLDSQGTT